MSIPPPEKDPKQKIQEGLRAAKAKMQQTFESFKRDEKVEKVLSYARSNVIDSTALALIAIGILLMLLKIPLGEALVGISIGYYFSSEVASFLQRYKSYLQNQDVVKGLFLSGALLAFIISAPYICLFAILAVALCQLVTPAEAAKVTPYASQGKMELNLPMTKKSVLYKVDFLTPAECKKIRDTVFSLKDHWIDRGRVVPFYTLGVASYMDSSREDDSHYREAAKVSNPILKAAFPDLYARLAKLLEKETGYPVQYEESLAYPGFHIFLSSKSFEKPLASVHFDLQFESIKWPYKEIDFAHPLSITLPIVLPHLGGGLNYWEAYRDEMKDYTKEQMTKYIETHPPKYMEYEVGKIVIQNDRLCLHQIAPGKNLTPGDERITLQGHGLVCDGILKLYW